MTTTIGARIAAGYEKGILDAVEALPRGGGLALLVAVPSAVAQSWMFPALQAKRMARTDRLGRRGVGQCKSAGSQQSQNYLAHESLLVAEAIVDRFIDLIKTGSVRSRQLTFLRDGADC